MNVLQNIEEVTTIPEALTNTALGMGTVFLVLILISFVIYLFKFIPRLMGKGKSRQPESRKTAPAASGAKKPQKTAASQGTDDAQLVAVMMAAIAAQMSEETGVPVAADGLVIRSIKKRTFSI